MEVIIKNESTPVNAIVMNGIQTVSTVQVPDSDQSINGYIDNHDVIDGRPNKKPKVEKEVVEYALPVGFLNPLTPEQGAVNMPLDNGTNDSNCTDVVVAQSLSKQFWKAGDYEGPVNESMSISVGMDHVRVHPRFLHSNATSHKWALGAFAELLDNALDEVRTGATYVNVDVLTNEKDTRHKMLLVEDNGGGMTPDKMRGCMSLGYSIKSKLANTIGQYGNGFKTSTMRLGADVLVFSRCPGQDGRNPTQSIGMLSYTFLMETGKEDIVVPMIDFEKRGNDWVMLARSSPADWTRNMETLVQWSPYSTEERLLQQFDYLEDQGTRIIIYNLWEDEEGQLELDFDTDIDDIQIRGANRDPKKIEMAKEYPNSRHFLNYQHSLRSYAAILYLRNESGFRIILRGKDVIHHNIVDDMMLTQEFTYMPQNNPNMKVEVTVGFVKDAKSHIDVQGFNVYHKNRLIKPFWRVWNAAGSDGRGVIGVLEPKFIEPAHDKQGFEHTDALRRLDNKLVEMQKKYWSTNCQEIGYARRCKAASHTKKTSNKDKHCKGASNTNKTSNKDEVYEDAVPIRMNTDNVIRKLSPIRNQESSKPMGHVQNDANVFTLRKKQCEAPISMKESNLSTSNSPLKSANGDGDIVSKLRLGSGESDMVNILLEDLRAERDKNVLLEKQLLEAQEKIDNLDKEQIALIEVFTEERNRRDLMEETLRKNLKDAMNTVEELRMQITGAREQ